MSKLNKPTVIISQHLSYITANHFLNFKLRNFILMIPPKH